MSENSKIEWCDHTYNAWIGCTKVSPGCANCYAEKSTRARVLRAAGSETWGKGAERSRTKTGGDPLKWNRDAEFFHECTACRHRAVMVDSCTLCGCDIVRARPRVFCASLSDWLDDEVPIEWLADLLQLIHDTPNLDWLLLTKRPANFWPRIKCAFRYLAETLDPKRVPALNMLAEWMGTEHCEHPGEAPLPPANVWIGTTVEDQTRADLRIPQLLAIPAKVRFLSCEPLLGPVDIKFRNRSFGFPSHIDAKGHAHGMPQGIHWVIGGGESGPGARPMHPEWIRSLRDQCQATGVPFLFKQWGEFSHDTENPIPTKNAGQFCYNIEKVGKKKAGRVLDGREWNEFPTGRMEA